MSEWKFFCFDKHVIPLTVVLVDANSTSAHGKHLFWSYRSLIWAYVLLYCVHPIHPSWHRCVSYFIFKNGIMNSQVTRSKIIQLSARWQTMVPPITDDLPRSRVVCSVVTPERARHLLYVNYFFHRRCTEMCVRCNYNTL